MIDLAGRVVIVTGAGGGLGRSHAMLLAERGARVVVNDIGGSVDGRGTGRGPAHEVVAELVAAGVEAVASTDSVATSQGGEKIVAAALDTFGRLDAVVHNAGILRDKTITKLDDDDLDSVIEVHLKGAFHLVRPAWAALKESGSGRIVLTSSASGILGNFGQSNYGAAKMGLVGMMNVLALEGARHGIKVNCLAPAARTRMNEALVGDLGAILEPAFVSPAVAYMCAAECSITGEIMAAAAGRFWRYFIGATAGWDAGRDAPATPEDLADHLDEIRSLEGHQVPESAAFELEVLSALRSQS